jgi:hypothetical protein
LAIVATALGTYAYTDNGWFGYRMQNISLDWLPAANRVCHLRRLLSPTHSLACYLIAAPFLSLSRSLSPYMDLLKVTIKVLLTNKKNYSIRAGFGSFDSLNLPEEKYV